MWAFSWNCDMFLAKIGRDMFVLQNLIVELAFGASTPRYMFV